AIRIRTAMGTFFVFMEWIIREHTKSSHMRASSFRSWRACSLTPKPASPGMNSDSPLERPLLANKVPSKS
ncbi:hypothetical protein HAX54_035720, partial [Datura stramonium]|nr:hypothetical protein [Datura stramonium]